MATVDRMRILGWVMSVPDKARLMGLFDDMEIPAGGSARQLAAQAGAAAGCSTSSR